MEQHCHCKDCLPMTTEFNIHLLSSIGGKVLKLVLEAGCEVKSDEESFKMPFISASSKTLVMKDVFGDIHQ